MLIRENRGIFSYQIILRSGEVPKSYFGSKLGLSSNLELFDRAHSCHQLGNPRAALNLVIISDGRIGRRVTFFGQSVPRSRSF